MKVATLEFRQTKNTNGEPVDIVTQQKVTEQGWKEIAESVFEAVKHLDVKETDTPGVFNYTHPTDGSGTVTLKDFYRSDIELATDLLRLMMISKSLGMSDPNRSPETTGFNLTQLRTTNPFFQMLLGAVSIVMGVAMFVVVMTDATIPGGLFVVLTTLAVVMMGAGLYILAWFGARRLLWWFKARAEARRINVPLPRQLRFWN